MDIRDILAKIHVWSVALILHFTPEGLDWAVYVFMLTSDFD